MKVSRFRSFLGLVPLALLGALLAPSAAHAQTATAADPVVLVDAMEDVFGKNAGKRRNHTKGLCTVGTFRASPQAAEYSRSPLFSGESLPVIGRFSLAGGRPGIPDATRNPRGMALQFELPGGQTHAMAMLNVPVFSAATPEAFVTRMQADRPDAATGKPDPARQQAAAAQYPEFRALAAWLAEHRPPPSYARTTYHSLNAFRFTNAAGKSRWVKWKFVPLEGEAELDDNQLKGAPPDFLYGTLGRRLAGGPVQWDLVLVLGEDGDPLDNPSLAWPAVRPEVTVGRLAIGSAGGTGCEAINFDPLRLSDGVEGSPTDRVLAFRSQAYAVSWARRTQEAASAK